MEDKTALLTEEITTLQSENGKLMQKVAELEAKLSDTAPRMMDFNETQIEILRYLFRSGRTSLTDLAMVLRMPVERIDLQLNLLGDAGLVQSVAIEAGLFRLTAQGRGYVVRQSLA